MTDGGIEGKQRKRIKRNKWNNTMRSEEEQENKKKYLCVYLHTHTDKHILNPVVVLGCKLDHWS